MAAVRISCFLALCVTFCVSAKSISGKAYYCRDPDTGKLHDVNTTWPSSTFCGNYICKLRKKNLQPTNVEVQSLRQLNITSRNNILVITNNTNKSENVTLTSTPDTNISHMQEIHRDISEDAKVIQKPVHEKIGNLDEQSPLRKGDRYLTDAEIKAFTEILHVMKKSDLEALMEIYIIAQEIYKEIDNATDENIIEETLRNLKENNTSETVENTISKSTSYWYEPLAIMSNKHRLNYDDFSKDTDIIQNVLDNLTQRRNNADDNVNSQEFMVKGPIVQTPKPCPHTVFKGVLNDDDFGNLLYFYPMSSFQRLNTYINPFPQNKIQYVPKPLSNNIQMPPIYQVIPPWYKPYISYPIKTYPDDTYNKKATDTKNVAKTQIVEYPFQSHQKNLTETEHSYFNAYPWSLYSLYPPIKKPVPQQLPHVNTAYMNYLPNTVQIAPEISEKKQDKEMDTSAKQPEITIPDWQTEPLQKSILDEVRANILMKSKLIPLRKKIKLERVSKIMNLEDIRKKRTKREAEEFEEYETYVEKNTCGSDTEPGFFRMGNITQPYPSCCPQRIGKGS